MKKQYLQKNVNNAQKKENIERNKINNYKIF